jgi:D-3-phosphoglycerate dehydrogenase
MLNVLVTGKILPQGFDILNSFAKVTVIEEPTYEKIAQVISSMDAILHKIGKLPAELIELAPKLKIISRHGVGLDDLDMPYLKKRNIKVTITKGANCNAVAEMTITLLLNLQRPIFKAHQKLVSTNFWLREQLIGQELKGQTLGLIGFGDIGSRVAEIANVFGMKIVAYEPYKEITHPFVKKVNLDELLRVSDAVSIHCPLTDETKGLINKENIITMKKNAVLINTARGGIVDEKLVFEMLKSKRLAGAALDVFSTEPPELPDDVGSIQNLILTPHIAAMTHVTQVKMATMAAEEIKNFFGK